MTIYDVLKESNARISSGFRWLIIDTDGTFIVYEKGYGDRNTKTVYCGNNENLACEALLD